MIVGFSFSWGSDCKTLRRLVSRSTGHRHCPAPHNSSCPVVQQSASSPVQDASNPRARHDLAAAEIHNQTHNSFSFRAFLEPRTKVIKVADSLGLPAVTVCIL